jgi:hypothetical protein
MAVPNGCDVRVLEHILNKADVSDPAKHAITDFPIVVASGGLTFVQGPLIGIFHQYAHLESGK